MQIDESLTHMLAWRGRSVHWQSFGEGPALVLLHGTPWSSALWRPIAEALSTQFTVYLWDMPGYGSSSKDPSHPVDLGLQGELFAELLDFWGLERPHVVAHDFGGAVALRARLLHGAAYASLCLVDVVALSPWGRRSSPSSKSTPLSSSSCRPPCIEAPSRHTSAGPATRAFARMTSPRSSSRGRTRKGRRRSTGRSRRPTSASRTRSNRCTARSPNPCTSSGGTRTPGSRATARNGSAAPSRTPPSPSSTAPAT
ncbi:alpha/beta fold hydrolase [Pseudoclavibacter terrae]|uniref:alpha/beta fold hydrolase n=1 Tax=Pseudoclavibacter terrae TaxID=1530195 RepID=UPI003A5C7B8B